MEGGNCSYIFDKYSLIIIGIVVGIGNILLYLCYYLYSSSSSFNKLNWNNQSIKDVSTKLLKGNCISIRRMMKDIVASLFSPSELISMLKIKFCLNVKKVSKASLDELSICLNDIDFCYATLNKVSRSFSFVIEELPYELKEIVCIFYLVLRGLDTVEDDINYPYENKIVLLRNFHLKLLIPDWSINNIGDTEDSKMLLNHFDKIINRFQSLDSNYQSVILDITNKMGNGMADFLDMNQSIDRIEDYNLYCHYVAGLVGQGLSSLFYLSGLEKSNLYLEKDLSNSMGLFLQKTNIIRDYCEDLQSGRIWWPKQIWINYASNINQFKKNPNGKESLQCLNHMIMDSLNHLFHVIDYLSRIENIQIFQFCSIPQLMALATLLELYNNPAVFTSIVKIRKGLTCKLILNSSNMKQVFSYFYLFIKKLQKKIRQDKNINNKLMYQLTDQLKNLCYSNIKS
jgi:farnesyl-diphosphate farnesyltransferase